MFFLSLPARFWALAVCGVFAHQGKAWAADGPQGEARRAVVSGQASRVSATPISSRRRLGLLATGVPANAAQLRRWARQVDRVLSETAEDLGLVVELAPAMGGEGQGSLRRRALAEERWLLVPSLLRVKSGSKESVELRLQVAVPGEQYVRVRSERFKFADLEVRAVVALRDMLRLRRQPGLPRPSPRRTGLQPRSTGKSAGRSVLATTATLYGGFIGYSLQRVSGSEDPRLLYPLMAVGSGLGLGVATLVTSEWDVGVGSAWYLSGGAWWPAIAGHLIHQGRFGQQGSSNGAEGWQFGLIASVTGVGLSSMGLLARPMTEGAALMANSAGGLGLITGGLIDLGLRGDVNEVPLAGMGYGAMAGWLMGSTAAIHLRPSAGRMTVLDLGIVLGGLVGASVASPLIFDDPNPTKTRGWVGACGGGMVIGGATAWLLTRESKSDSEVLAYLPAPAWMTTGPGLQWSGAW